MAEHLATITWTRGTDDFLDKRYHRAHRWQFDGGATVAAWYPITPSTSLRDAFKSFCQKLRVDPETGRWFATVAPTGAPLVTFEPALGWTFPLELGKVVRRLPGGKLELGAKG